MKEFIDGAAFGQMVIYAASSINLHKQEINDLNVFPVPDGDTGTNMSLTMSAASNELKKQPTADMGKAAEIAAKALLRGARGNSGVILSLLFRGFAKGVKDRATIDGAELAAALSEGVGAAYNAVMKPAEGTILTVSRRCAKRAMEAAEINSAVEYVLEAAIERGKSALADTINQNPVLKKAGVIDAGGKGYLIILQGMLSALRGEPMPQVTEAAPEKERASFSEFSQEEITFGYCTEFIVSREGAKPVDGFRSFLNDLGDSLVLVDDEEIIKVHVHTDHPGKALEEALNYGSLLTVKVENMREQHSHIIEEEGEGAGDGRKVAPPEKEYGFVAVCAGDGLKAVFSDLGCDGVIGGGQTMNPSTEDILKAVDQTPSEIVYVLPNNKNIIMAAQQCEGLSEKKVVVIPSKSVPQGIAALLAVDPDREEAANTQEMTEAISQVKTVQITYAARDSEFDGHHISEKDYLALVDDKLFGTNQDIKTLFDTLTEQVADETVQFITIYYGEDVSEEDAQGTMEQFAAACPGVEISLLRGGQPVYYYVISLE